MNIQNLSFLRYIHCNSCLNLHITHGDMEENVGERFFLNTVYIITLKLQNLELDNLNHITFNHSLTTLYPQSICL